MISLIERNRPRPIMYMTEKLTRIRLRIRTGIALVEVCVLRVLLPLHVFALKLLPTSQRVEPLSPRKISQVSRCAFCIIGERGNHILMKFCTVAVVHNQTIHANFGVCRFRFLLIAGMEFPTFPSTCVVVLETLWRYRTRV